MKNSYKKKVGSIFFIPLFLPNDIKNNRKNYQNYRFLPKETYAFGRLIEIDQSSGDLVEIFNYAGSIPENSSVIIESGRIFYPLHVTMGFEKRRWGFIFDNNNYDKFKDSKYSDITFLLGDFDTPKLWKGGKDLGSLDTEKAELYNNWVVYPPTQLEDKIREKLVVHLKSPVGDQKSHAFR